MVIGPVDGPCISFQDLITGEKNVAGGEAWHPDKWREVVSVQIGNWHIKGDMGGERKRHRERECERQREIEREREDKLLRLEKGQTGSLVLP